MSLTTFVELPDVKERLRALHPKIKRRIDTPLRVPSRSNRPDLIGTAFDYLLRFELKRRATHAVERGWVAVQVAGLINTSTGEMYLERGRLIVKPQGKDAELARRAVRVVQRAQADVEAYRREEASDLRPLAAHALRLAKLDVFYRAGVLDPTFEETESDDVEELLELMAIVPYEELIAEPLFLNPSFGMFSELVRGADADLIVGDMLIDIKTIKETAIALKTLNQLLGYFLLARAARRIDRPNTKRKAKKATAFGGTVLPEIRRVGIYFSRHGFLWTQPTSAWTGHPQFEETERWFLERADQARTTARARFDESRQKFPERAKVQVIDREKAKKALQTLAEKLKPLVRAERIKLGEVEREFRKRVKQLYTADLEKFGEPWWKFHLRLKPILNAAPSRFEGAWRKFQEHVTKGAVTGPAGLEKARRKFEGHVRQFAVAARAKVDAARREYQEHAGRLFAAREGKTTLSGKGRPKRARWGSD